MSTNKKVVLITGASAGIGESLARVYSKKGFSLALCGRNSLKLQNLAKELRAQGTEVVALERDVRIRAEFDNFVAQTLETFGRIDVVIANAGFGVYGEVENLKIADFERQFATNIYGVIHTVQSTLKALKSSKGRLAIVGSGYGYLTMPGLAPYTMSKYAVRALAETLYFELRKYGISVTHISPGTIGTDFRKRDNQGNDKDGGKEVIPGFIVMDSMTAAKKIAKAIENRRAERVLTAHAYWGVWIKNHWPSLYNRVIHRATPFINKFMTKAF